MKCPVCTCQSLTTHGDLTMCGSCKHMWQTDLEVKAVYNADYVRNRYDSYDTTEVMSYLRLGFVKAIVRGARGTRLLDVGYGNGSFLKAATKAGFDTFGNDVHGADYGIRNVPMEEAAELPWDVVTFFDSLEHFDSLELPRKLISRARIVIVSIPCRPESFPVRREWRHYRPGEHLHYFSTYSLELFGAYRHFVAARSDAEDAIRGRLASGHQNILTMAFVER